MGVVPRKLPRPPESLVDTQSNGLVSFPHPHLCGCRGTSIFSLGTRDLVESSLLPTAYCEKAGWGSRTPSSVRLPEIGPYLRPGGDPVRLALRLPTLPVRVAMMIQPFSPRQPLGSGDSPGLPH